MKVEIGLVMSQKIKQGPQHSFLFFVDVFPIETGGLDETHQSHQRDGSSLFLFS